MECALDGLFKVADVLQTCHLVVIDVVIVLEQCDMSFKCLLLCCKLSDDWLELLFDQRSHFSPEYIREGARIRAGRQHEYK
jgi:hypothetical protein